MEMEASSSGNKENVENVNSKNESAQSSPSEQSTTHPDSDEGARPDEAPPNEAENVESRDSSSSAPQAQQLESLAVLLPNNVLEWAKLGFLASAAERRFNQSGDVSDIEEAIGYHRQCLLPPITQPRMKPGTLNQLGKCLRKKYERQRLIQDLEEAIQCHREALHLCPSGNQDRLLSLYNLAVCLYSLYSEQNGASTLADAIEMYREGLLLAESGSNSRLMLLNDLAICLHAQYKRNGTMESLKEAILYHQEGLSLCPAGHPDRSRSLNNLAVCLFTCYRRQGDITDLSEAIKYHKEALELYPPGHRNRLGSLSNLAVCYQARYQRDGLLQNLLDAIECHEEALQYSSDGLGHVTPFRNLANCYFLLHKRQDDPLNLSKAILYHKKALDICPSGYPDHPIILNDLSACFKAQYDKQGVMQDLEKAMDCLQRALELFPHGHTDRLKAINNLAACLQTRYKVQGTIEDLLQAIQCHKEALKYRPPGDPSRSGSLNNLAVCLNSKYLHSGAIEDIEEAIKLNRSALLLSSPDSPHHLAHLNNLANCLRARFKLQGYMHDLNEAITCHREALELCPPGHSDRSSSLNNLAVCLQAVYEHQQDITALEETIKCYKEALTLHPKGHPYRPTSLCNLAICLHTQYEQQSKNIDHLLEAIQCLRESLNLLVPEHPERSESLKYLARCLEARYRAQNDGSCLMEAVERLQEALRMAPQDHPSKAMMYAYLAALYTRYSDNLGGADKIEESSILFEKATTHTPASLRDRFNASLMWIANVNGPIEIHAYRRCLELADRYVLIRSSMTSRHELISTYIPQNIASDATAAAIRMGDLRKAVEFLEQGRTLLWSQMGRYRTPLEKLREVNPYLAEELKRLGQLLEDSATSAFTSELYHQSMEMESRKYRQIANDWDAVVTQIRGLHGFQSFLQPPEFSTLQPAADGGPVVIVNISAQRCDAIIMQKDVEPVLVPLPEARMVDIRGNSAHIVEAVKKGSEGRARVLFVLRALWDDIVKPIVDALEQCHIPRGSRIWWCPTSELALLPLHAAGPHRPNKLNLYDLYISSYTPTLSALITSSRKAVLVPGPSFLEQREPSILIIAQPETPGQIEIPSVWLETQRIKQVAPSVELLLDKHGTHSIVLERLKTHRCVHFACHGYQKPQDPFSSCFYLYDKSLTLLDIAKAHLVDAQFAFLSACHTAAGDRSTPDETIHLAAGLQFSGFRSVIGTMYAMADINGPDLAEEVYKHLFRQVGKGKGKPEEVAIDYKEAAEALHVATNTLIRKGVPVERWINFVHIGA